MALFKIKSVISSKDQDLLEAAKSGDVEAIVKITSKKRQSTASQVFTSFLKGSININCVDREGYTPLHLATLNGHKSAVECLLNLDASVSSKDNSGCTPLHLAAWKGYDEICTLFLTFTNAIIPIDVQNSLGDTALHMAAQYGYKDVVEVLLKYNVDATIRNLKDQSALDLAAQYGRHDVVQLLVTKNPDLVKHTVTSHSPLHLAASCGHVQIISTLLEAGYDINTTTTGGTALHIAAMYCKTEVVKLLVEKGIDIHAQDGEGKTALEIVLKNDQSQQKYAEIAKFIRDHIMISGAADDPHDDSNVYDTSFNVKSATPPPLAPAVEEDITKDQTASSKPEGKEEPEIKTRPVPKPRLSLGDAVNEEERKSALYTKPDKTRNRIDDSPVSVRSISPPKPAPRESKAISPDFKFEHYPPDLPKKERDSVPPLPPKTDDIPILPPKVMSPTADMVVADLPPVRSKSQGSFDGPPPCEGGTVDSEYTEDIYANVTTGYFVMTKPVDTEGSTLSPASKKKRPAKPPRKKSPAPSRKMEQSPINVKEIDKEEYETMSNVKKTESESSFTEDVYNALFSGFKTESKDSSDTESINMSTASESPSCDTEYTNIGAVAESLSCDPEYTNIGSVVSELRSCDQHYTNKNIASESLSSDPEYTNTSMAAEYRSSKFTADDEKTVPFTKYSEPTSPSKDIRTERVESHCTELRGEIQSTSRSSKLDRTSTGFGQTSTSDEIHSESKDPLSVINSESDKTIPEVFDSKENSNDCKSIPGTENLCESNNCDSDIPDGDIGKSCSINRCIPEKSDSIGNIPDNTLQTEYNIPKNCLQTENNIPQNTDIPQKSVETESSVSVVSSPDNENKGTDSARPEIKPRPKSSYKPLANSPPPELPPKSSLSDLTKDLVVDEKRISNGSGEPKDFDECKTPKPHSLEFTKKRLSEHRFPTTPTGYPQPPTPDFPPPSPHTARKGIEQKIADIEVPSNKRSSRDIETITEDLVMDGKMSGDNLSQSNTKETSDQAKLQKVENNVPIKQKESTEHIESESERRSHDKKDEEEVVVLRKSSRTSTGSGGQEVLIGDDLEPFAGLLRGSVIGGPRKVVSQIYEHVAVPLKRTGGKRTSLPLSNMTFEPVMEREEDGGHDKRPEVDKSHDLRPVKLSGMKEDSSFDDKDEWDQIADIVSSFGGKLSHDESVSVNDTDMNHLLEGSNPSIHSVGEWLESLSLGQYENTLYANGFDDTDFLGEKIMEEQDLESIGISTSDHRKKILDQAKRLPQIKPINADCPPVSVEVWLNSLRLPQYLDKFISQKYNTMERVLQVWELELSTVLDISSMGHRKRILASLGDRSPPERQFASLKKKSRVDDHQDKKSPFTDINLFKDYTKVKPLTSTSEEDKSSKPQTPSVENSDNDEVFHNNIQGKSIKDTSIHIRPPHQANTTAPIKQWRHRPEMLIKGCCNYTAQYLGSTLVKELTGTSSTIEGITKLKKSADAIAKIPTIMLSISYRGVKFIDAKSKKVICDHEIVNIFCACQDAESMNFFAYITRDNETCKHYCHVFSVRTADLAREVIMTLGEAFEVAYQMAQKEKAAEEAKEFERTLSQSDADDSSQSISSSKASLNTV